MYKCSNCGKTYTQDQVRKVGKNTLSVIGCGRCKQIGTLEIDYDVFKLTVFRTIFTSSRSYIEARLELLSRDFNIPYNEVVTDFNKETHDYWQIETK